MLASNSLSAQTNNDKDRMLDRFLTYVRIESQSTYPDDPMKELCLRIVDEVAKLKKSINN